MKKFRGLKISIFAFVTVLIVTGFSALLMFAFNKENKSNHIDINAAWSGSGTAADPYLIQSISDFDTLSRNVANANTINNDDRVYKGVHFKLMADLDYAGQEFLPIGSRFTDGVYSGYRAFGGVFDGNGHYIKNIEMDVKVNLQSGVVGLGLFASLGYQYEYYSYNSSNGTYVTLDRDVTVKNLLISNMSVTVSSEGEKIPYVFVGAIAGISDTYTNNITHNDSGNKQTYRIKYSTTISDCVVDGFNVNTSFNADVGGLIGAELTSKSSSSTGGYEELTISRCIVNDISVSNRGGLCAVISPAFAHMQTSRWNASFFYTKQHFGYSHTIGGCFTNNTSLYAINSSTYDQAFVRSSVDMCKVNRNVHSSYVYDAAYEKYTSYICDKSYYFQYITWAGGSTYFEGKGWKASTNYFSYLGIAYPKSMLIKLPLSAAEGGTITASYISCSTGNNSENGPTTSFSDFYVKKTAEITLNGNNLQIPHTDGSTITIIPTANEGYEFIGWTGDLLNGYTANFRDMYATCQLTFEASSNTNITSNMTYTVVQGEIVNVVLNKQSCKFTFKNDSGSEIVVTYNVNKDVKIGSLEYSKYYIDKCLYTGGEKQESGSITINSNTNISVSCILKFYGIGFK